MVSSRLEKLMYRDKPATVHFESFQFDKLTAPPLASLLSEYDMMQLYEIARDPKLSARIKKKYNMINQILNPRGFKLLGRGTNRCAYKHYEFPNIVLKVPIDKVGMSDGFNEYQNQWLLQPFVAKTFEIHPSGISLHERVQPLTSHRELELLADDYFNLVTKVFIGKYVMEDIGEQYFMNWGIRPGFGLVLLDYPYLFELDIAKLRCNAPDPKNPYNVCMGEIDYDMGFNHLYCSKCGKRYAARELGKSIENNQLIYNIYNNSKGGSNMENVVVTITKNGVSRTIGKGRKEIGPMRRRPEKPSPVEEPMKVTIIKGGVSRTFCEGKLIGTSELTYKPSETHNTEEPNMPETEMAEKKIGDFLNGKWASDVASNDVNTESVEQEQEPEAKEAEVIEEPELPVEKPKFDKNILKEEKERFAENFNIEAIKYFNAFKGYNESESTEELFRASMEELINVMYNEDCMKYKVLKLFNSYRNSLVEGIMNNPEIKEYFANKNKE